MFDLTKPWPLGLNRRNWPIYLAAVVAMIAVLSTIDVAASRGAIAWPDEWRAPFFMITDYGLSDWVLIPSLAILILSALIRLPLKDYWRRVMGEVVLLSGFIFVGVGAPGLITNLFKRLVGRGRPVEFETAGAFAFQPVVNDWTYQSFPSGHSATAMAMAFVVGFLWQRALVPFVVIAIIVGISRVPVGAHYPTDVLAGLVVGMLGTYLVRNMFASRGWLFEKRDDGRIYRKPLTALPKMFQRASV